MARSAPSAIVGLLLALPAFTSATTWHITPDGLGDSPTIQGGLDLCAPGDTVSLGCGTFIEANLDATVDFTLRSDTGDPSCVTIIGDRQETILRLLSIDAALEGVTIANGQGAAGGVYAYGSTVRVTDCVFRDNNALSRGGGMQLTDGSSGEFERCRFQDNSGAAGGLAVVRWSSATLLECQFVGNDCLGGGALHCDSQGQITVDDCLFEENTALQTQPGVGSSGGAINCSGGLTAVNCRFLRNTADRGGAIRFVGTHAPSTVSACTFVGNTAGSAASLFFGGGAIYSDDAAPEFLQCTFFGNVAVDRGAVLYSSGANAPTFTGSILAFSQQAAAAYCYLDAAAPQFVCCDLYGNELGDWVGCLSGQNGVDGNFSADPLFCDVVGEDFRLQPTSPCLPDNSPPGCGLLGPLGACGATAAGDRESSTWALLKARYR